MALNVMFYGTRGQIMSVSRDRFIYGGHTPCIAVRDDSGLLVLDAGFGIANLARELMQSHDLIKGRHEFHIALTHFHWDHIQGLQYFSPIYFPGNTIHVYTPFPDEVVQEVFNLLLDGSYTPFDGLASLPCTWRFHQLSGPLALNGFTLDFLPTVHVGPAYAYRVAHKDGVVVYSGDHDATPSAANDAFVAWAKGCDVLIHEAMFTPSEYQNNATLGHSSFIFALENAQRIGAANTLLTHHAPLRSDSDLAEHERYLERLYNRNGRRLAFAREGVPYPVTQTPSK